MVPVTTAVRDAHFSMVVSPRGYQGKRTKIATSVGHARTNNNKKKKPQVTF